MAGIRQRVVPLATLVAAFALTSCVSEKTVYRDVNGPTPPAAAANFVGYANTSTKQTVCGNCHVDLQTAWVQTKHASAWTDLQASGHSAAYCEDCHAVSPLGNGASGTVGWSATKDTRYQDVQCENCHGAGATHTANPGLGNRPLASLAVDTTASTKFTCAGCHTGTHEPFVDQWKASAHNYVDSHAGTASASCQGCHTGGGALSVWGVVTNYKEKADTATKLPLTCAVCHDPHAKKNDNQLRFSITATDTSKNLCMKCHNRAPVPQWTNTRYGKGTHAPEAGTVLGYAGWFPPGLMTDPTQGGAIVATHGSSSNPNLCATCHVSRFTVNDSKSAFLFQATGHTFNATPCLDSLNRPLAPTGCTPDRQSFKACTNSGCHGSEASARGALQTAISRNENLIEELQGQLAKVPQQQKDTLGFTVARGALFNISVAQGGEGDAVMGRLKIIAEAGPAAHNPFLVEQLLINSIKAVQTRYGIAPSKGVNLNVMLGKH